MGEKKSLKDRLKWFAGLTLMTGTVLMPNASMANDTKVIDDGNMMEQTEINIEERESLKEVLLSPHSVADMILNDAKEADYHNKKIWNEQSLEEYYKIGHARKVTETEKENIENQRKETLKTYTPEQLAEIENLKIRIDNAKKNNNMDELDNIRVEVEQVLEKIVDPRIVKKDSTNDILRVSSLFEDLNSKDFSSMTSEDIAKFIVDFKADIKYNIDVLKLKQHLLQGNNEYQALQASLKATEDAINPPGKKTGGLRRATQRDYDLKREKAFIKANIAKVESQIELDSVKAICSKDKNINIPKQNAFLAELKVDTTQAPVSRDVNTIKKELDDRSL